MIEIIRGLDIDEYHEHEALSKTKIWYWQDVPPLAWRYRYIENHKASDKTHYAEGRALDTLIFDGQDMFTEKFAQRPDTYQDAKTKEEKAWSGNATVCKDWLKDQAAKGTTILSPDAMNEVMGMFRAYKRQLGVSEDLARLMQGEAQVTMRGWLPGYGVVQSRPDLVNFARRYSLDLKTSRSVYAHEKDFVKFGYHVQVALVDELAKAAGLPLDDHYHLVIEKSAWPRIRIFRIPDDMVEYGKRMAQRLCGEILEAIGSNEWEKPVRLEHMVVPQWIQDRVVHGEELRSQQFFGEADSFDWDKLITGEK